jgi:hypothetical protein
MEHNHNHRSKRVWPRREKLPAGRVRKPDDRHKRWALKWRRERRGYAMTEADRQIAMLSASPEELDAQLAASEAETQRLEEEFRFGEPALAAMVLPTLGRESRLRWTMR